MAVTVKQQYNALGLSETVTEEDCLTSKSQYLDVRSSEDENRVNDGTPHDLPRDRSDDANDDCANSEANPDNQSELNQLEENNFKTYLTDIDINSNRTFICSGHQLEERSNKNGSAFEQSQSGLRRRKQQLPTDQKEPSVAGQNKIDKMGAFNKVKEGLTKLGRDAVSADNEPLLAYDSLASVTQGGSVESQIHYSRSTNDEEEEENDSIVKFSTSSSLVVKGETAFTIFVQVLFPFIIAGLGTVAAGSVLDKVQNWAVFSSITELFILVPALLGLKGNLEMTLASRLSTAANLGAMDNRSSLATICIGNFLLTQVQAIVVGLLASMLACLLAYLRTKVVISVGHAVILCSAAIATASTASAILSILMIGVVWVSRKLKLNPDNIATPVAASFGDLITLSLLATSSSILYRSMNPEFWPGILFIICMLGLIPLLSYVCYQNETVKPVLIHGWTPIIGAMSISSMGGLLLDKAQQGYKTFAPFCPVINGVGGNLVAIQASRISTYLHATFTRGNLFHYSLSSTSSERKQSWMDVHKRIIYTFILPSNPHAKSAIILLSLVIPGNFFFAILQTVISQLKLPVFFYFVFVAASLSQVLILLLIADWLVHLIWKFGHDPDNSAIPYLTALGDLLGTGFLTLGYYFLSFSHISL